MATATATVKDSPVDKATDLLNRRNEKRDEVRDELEQSRKAQADYEKRAREGRERIESLSVQLSEMDDETMRQLAELVGKAKTSPKQRVRTRPGGKKPQYAIPTDDAVVLLPAEIGFTFDDLRESVSSEAADGKVREFIEYQDHKYAVIEWERAPVESFTLLRLIEEAHWQGTAYDAADGFKGYSGLRVAGPDGVCRVLSEVKPLVVRARGEGA